MTTTLDAVARATVGDRREATCAMGASMPGWPEPKPPCASFTTFVGDERAYL
jgi:hypothetical protein